MEKPVPMDRVISGDVGYGKTEIAVRAAFKAVQDGKQVVILVPTTLLAQQHLSTFSDRMEQFPITIRGLSRFTSNTEAAQTIKGLADGSVDIVIGTHRLLQPTIRWKDLGLVVVDEEQRFGVEHKEHITALRAHVDMLTMTRDADPADPGDEPRRHPGDVDHHHPAGGTPPDPDLRRRIRRQAGRRGDPSRTAPRGTGLLRAQPGGRHRVGGPADPGGGSGGADRRRARADGRGPPGEDHRRVLGA